MIATGFAERTDPAALVVGPTGVGLGHNGTLYVADTVNSRIAAIPDALTRRTPVTGGGQTLTSGGALNGPLGLTIAPNGDVLTTNGGDGNLVETTPGGSQVAQFTLDTTGGARRAVRPATAPRSGGVLFVDDGDNTLRPAALIRCHRTLSGPAPQLLRLVGPGPSVPRVGGGPTSRSTSPRQGRRPPRPNPPTGVGGRPSHATRASELSLHLTPRRRTARCFVAGDERRRTRRARYQGDSCRAAPTQEHTPRRGPAGRCAAPRPPRWPPAPPRCCWAPAVGVRHRPRPRPGRSARAARAAAPCTARYTAVRSVGRRGGGVLRVPEALAIGPSGEVYEGDQFSYVVQRFTPGGRFLGQWGSYGSGPGQFGSVGALAVDGHGDVYVLDSTNDRIEVFSATGRFLRSWGGRGTGLGQFRFGGGGRAEIPPGGGLAVSGSSVYVADSGGDRIERFNLQGGDASAFGAPGGGPGEFSDPRGLTIADGRLYVADDQNHRIQVLGLDGSFIAQTPRADNGVAHLADPYDVAVDAQGDLFVADDNNNRIVRFTPALTYADVVAHARRERRHDRLHPRGRSRPQRRRVRRRQRA